MCLTIPKRITAIKGGFIFVKPKTGKIQAVGTAIKNIKKGDWVLTHNDIIIAKISAKKAGEISVLLKEVK